jgi:hypothetical protein
MGGTKLDKVCILGVYEFIGFHLCKRFLENGFSVEGVHLNTECDLFLEEKRLEVGRNANFNEKSFPLSGKNLETDVTIIPIYDWFMTYKESRKRFSEIIQYIKNAPKTNFVFLLPIQMLTDSQDEGMEEARGFIEQTNNLAQSIQYYYLPTIFGPWQPSSFLFQNEILNQFHQTNKSLDIREWPFDAIYIDDLLTPLIEKIESGESGSFLFESGIPKSWELCAEILQLDKSLGKVFDEVKLKVDDGVEKITLKEVTPYQESLMTQKEHVSFISNMLDHS